MYSVEPIHAKHRIELFFDAYRDHDPKQFLVDLRRAASLAKGAGRHFDVLADFSQSIVMPQDIAQDSAGIAKWFIANGMRKSANIITCATQRMQLRRVTERSEQFGIFETRIAAERWLEG